MSRKIVIEKCGNCPYSKDDYESWLCKHPIFKCRSLWETGELFPDWCPLKEETSKMDDKMLEEITKKVIDTITSLNNAVEITGRIPIQPNDLTKMSLFHFICHVAAPNGIRFVRIAPDLPSRDEEDD